MNQSDPFEEVDDEAVELLLSPLRKVEPPPAARAAIHVAIAAELERGTVRRHTQWWRRTITVPVPVALTAALLVVVSMTWSLLAQRRLEPSATQPQSAVPASPESASPHRIAVRGSQSEIPEVEYYSSEIYLCGVGRISSVSGYSIREDQHAP